MVLRLVRALTALVLIASGALLHAASWQRWSGPCPWGLRAETAACNKRMDHLYDFLFIGDPWTPVGNAAGLAGPPCSSWSSRSSCRGRSPGYARARITAGLVVSALVVADVGLATRRSGTGRPGRRARHGQRCVRSCGCGCPPRADLAAVRAHAVVARAAAIFLVLATPAWWPSSPMPSVLRRQPLVGGVLTGT